MNRHSSHELLHQIHCIENLEKNDTQKIIGQSVPMYKRLMISHGMDSYKVGIEIQGLRSDKLRKRVKNRLNSRLTKLLLRFLFPCKGFSVAVYTFLDLSKVYTTERAIIILRWYNQHHHLHYQTTYSILLTHNVI